MLTLSEFVTFGHGAKVDHGDTGLELIKSRMAEMCKSTAFLLSEFAPSNTILPKILSYVV